MDDSLANALKDEFSSSFNPHVGLGKYVEYVNTNLFVLEQN